MNPNPHSAAQLDALAYTIADNACVCDIETGAGVQTDAHGQRWYDTRVMLDMHEMSPDFIEMNRQAIDYAVARGLVQRNDTHAHLVRVVRPA